MPGGAAAAAVPRAEAWLGPRRAVSRRFFEREAGRLARLCHAMAERFARGGRLIACGVTPPARSDVRHVAVEFVHPVIVGKRALPALGLTGDGGPMPLQVGLLVEPDDILIAFDVGPAEPQGPPETRARAAARAGTMRAAIRTARELGALTIAFEAAGAEWELEPETDDPFIRQELVETSYHVLWELVHVFFEHRGLLEGRGEGPRHDAGGSAFLYPFLAEEERDLEGVIEDVRRSILVKARDVAELRGRTVEEAWPRLTEAAQELRRRLDAGGRVLALGNGGSATDAMDVVADFRAAPQGWPARAALDLTEDAAILTAIGNDIGPEAVFSRQIIAYGRAEDALLAFSTSGDSRNVVRALEEARRRGLYTVAFVGYEGGRIAAEGLSDVVVLSRSQDIPRIQEAQATAYHILRGLVEAGSG